MPKYVSSLNLNKNELQNAVIQNLAAAPNSPSVGQTYFDTVINHSYIYNGSGWEQASGGTGSVTSVAMTGDNVIFNTSITGSPITTAGTLVPTLKNQLANTVAAGPVSGGAAPLTVRLLVAADIPTVTSTKISDFDTQVRTSRLDQMAVPTASVSFNNQKIINLADPTAAQDAATKGYVDLTVQGLNQKPTAIVATTTALPANTYANGTNGVGATLTATANGALTVDGYTIANGDLVLVKDEATASHNGLYLVSDKGSGSTPYILTRHPDMDTAVEFAGAFIPAGPAGTTNANSLWLLSTTGAITVGITSINFTELNKAADLIAGTGITLSANTVSISTSYVGQTSITTLGTITTGTWQGTTVGVLYGGTGATTTSAARTNLNAAGKYQTTVGNGSATSFTITQATHGLVSDSSILVQVSDDSTGAVVIPDISINKTNGTVTITFTVAPTTNQYRVILIG